MDNRESIRRASSSGLLEGAAILGVAAVISKLLGTLQKIPLQNLAGDGVFGIYNAVYPLYILLLTLATAGIPSAVAKLVSEDLAVGNRVQAERLLRIACFILFVSGLLFFLILYSFAGTIANWIGIAQTEPAIRTIAAALLIVPVMAALRGYFQGHNNMVPTAVSQVIEQVVRVATMVLMLALLLHWGTEDQWIAAGATFGSVTGGLAALLFLIAYRLRVVFSNRTFANRSKIQRQSPHRPQVEEDRPGLERGKTAGRLVVEPVQRASVSSLVSRFLRYAIPISLGSLAVPLLTLTDTFTLPRLLLDSGLSETEALQQFGLYHHGMPLIQLITLVAGSMSAALVPVISRARVRDDWVLIRRNSVQATHFACWIGLAASLGLALLSMPLNVMFYRFAVGWEVIAILAFIALFSTVHIVTSALLQGMGDVRKPVYHLFAATAVKLALNAALVPLWGIQGAAVAAVAAYGVACSLNLLALHTRGAGISWSFQAHSKALLAVLAMCGAVAILLLLSESLLPLTASFLSYRIHYTAVSLLAVAIGVFVFAFVFLKGGRKTPDQEEYIFVIESKLRSLFKKIGFIK